jgi:hypothetical protein
MRGVTARGLVCQATGMEVARASREDPRLARAFDQALAAAAAERMRRGGTARGWMFPDEEDRPGRDGGPAAPLSPPPWPAPTEPVATATGSAPVVASVTVPMPAGGPPDGPGGGLPAASSWQLILGGAWPLQATLQRLGGPSSGWQVRLVADGKLGQAARPCLEALRQRLQARRPLDDCLLGEDE